MAPSPGPRAARLRERFREFAPPELLDIETSDELSDEPSDAEPDEADGDAHPRERPEYPRLVLRPESAT